MSKWRKHGKGRNINAHGYVRINIGNNTWMLEHRCVMEQHLGRKLRRDEVLRHINGDRQDNRLENLILLNRGMHQADVAKRMWGGDGRKPARILTRSDITPTIVARLQSLGLNQEQIAWAFSTNRPTIRTRLKPPSPRPLQKTKRPAPTSR